MLDSNWGRGEGKFDGQVFEFYKIYATEGTYGVAETEMETETETEV